MESNKTNTEIIDDVTDMSPEILVQIYTGIRAQQIQGFPIATQEQLGVVKVGTGLDITEDGVLSVSSTSFSGASYSKTILRTDWIQNGDSFKSTILKTEHNINNPYIASAVRINSDGSTENILFSCKVYTDQRVAILLDEQIDCKIIIRGE